MLNYKSYGRGKAVVLLHGYAGGLGYWLPLIMGLKNGFHIVALDLPGFAGSADVPAPDSIAGYASCVIDLMDQLKIEKASMLGFSMGGMIAQQAALDFPDRMETLILYGSSAVGDLPHRFEPWEAAIARIERRRRGPGYRRDERSRATADPVKYFNTAILCGRMLNQEIANDLIKQFWLFGMGAMGAARKHAKLRIRDIFP